MIDFFRLTRLLCRLTRRLTSADTADTAYTFLTQCGPGPVLFHANRHTGSGRRLDNRPSILECGVIMEDVWGSKALSRRGAFRHCLNGDAEPALVFETGRAR